MLCPNCPYSTKGSINGIFPVSSSTVPIISSVTKRLSVLGYVTSFSSYNSCKRSSVFFAVNPKYRFASLCRLVRSYNLGGDTFFCSLFDSVIIASEPSHNAARNSASALLVMFSDTATSFPSVSSTL